MGKKNLTFGDTEIEKNRFYCHKIPISLKHVDIEKVLGCSKISSSEKNYIFFIGYLYNDYKVKP